MREIELSKGYYAKVDDDQFERLNSMSWCVMIIKNKYSSCVYAQTNIKNGDIRRTLRMHRFIMDAKRGQTIDHINGDTLDNRKANLRFCDRAENACNSKKRKNCSSIYKGVCWSKKYKKWLAQIHLNDRTVFLGYSKNEIVAARLYDAAALKYFGEFAKINNI